MRRLSRRKFFLNGLSFFFLLFSFYGLALAANEPPPSSSADIIEKKIRKEAQEKLLESKAAPVAAPQPEKPEKPQPVEFKVRRIRLQGTKNLPTEELKKLVPFEELQGLIKPYLNRTLSQEDLTALLHKIEDAYRARGYLAAVGVPHQEMKDGELLLEILISRMGDLHVEGNRYFRAAKTRSYWKIPKGKILRLSEMQSSLQAMNENPDREIRSGLKAGTVPESTDVYLNEKDHFPIHPGFSYDDQGAKLTGRDRFGFNIKDNNFLTLDDVFLIGTAFGNHFGALYLQHLLPLNSVGTRLVTGYSHSEVYPQKEFRTLGIKGLSNTYTIQLRQKISMGQRAAGDVYTGLDFKEKTNRTQGDITAWDRLRVIPVGVDLQMVDSTGAWTVGPAVSFGFSPHGDGFPLTTRQGESNFIKYNFQITRQQKLFWETKGILHFETQLTRDKLTSQEELSLGGAQSVRGYPESDYLADQGFIVNAEYQVPFFLAPKDFQLPYAGEPLRQQIQLLSFVDYGYGSLHVPSSTENRAQGLIGVGGGLSIKLRKNLFLRLEWAAAVGDHPLTEGGRSQFHFKLQAEV